jgi:long-chain acyl-CoA synthetase
MSFLRICFGATVMEGYGMTEAACTISTTRSDDLTTGHVGAPNPAVEVKLVDLPEMGYTSRDSPYPR